MRYRCLLGCLAFLTSYSAALSEGVIIFGTWPNGSSYCGWNYNYSSRQEAINLALAACSANGAYNCTVQHTFNNLCYAIAVNNFGGCAYTTAADKSDAHNGALRQCATWRRDCWIQDSGCDTVSELAIREEENRRVQERSNEAYDRYVMQWNRCIDLGQIEGCNEALTYDRISSGDKKRLEKRRSDLSVRDLEQHQNSQPSKPVAGPAIPFSASPSSNPAQDLLAWFYALPKESQVGVIAGIIAAILLVLFIVDNRGSPANRSASASNAGRLPDSPPPLPRTPPSPLAHSPPDPPPSGVQVSPPITPGGASLDNYRLGQLLMQIGFVGIGVSFCWWLIFYLRVNQFMGGSASDMKHALRCLFSNSGPCGFIQGVANAAGQFGYEPMLLWLSGIVALGGLILRNASRPGPLS